MKFCRFLQVFYVYNLVRQAKQRRITYYKKSRLMIWNQFRFPPADEWIEKMWATYTLEF